MKTCIDCKHFSFEPAEPGYSEVTPGSDMSISCRKDIWFAGMESSAETFRNDMRRAATCPKFEAFDGGQH